jgi:hypothetical protein
MLFVAVGLHFFIKGPSHGNLILKGTVTWDSYSERDRLLGFLF